jgi:hypothetical protein
MPRHSTDTNLSQHEIGVLQRREQHGWFVNLIAGDALGPGFAYSFGLYEEFGHPEIIIFGIAEETMHRLIKRCGKAGAKRSQILCRGSDLGPTRRAHLRVRYGKPAPVSRDVHVDRVVL